MQFFTLIFAFLLTDLRTLLFCSSKNRNGVEIWVIWQHIQWFGPISRHHFIHHIVTQWQQRNNKQVFKKQLTLTNLQYINWLLLQQAGTLFSDLSDKHSTNNTIWLFCFFPCRQALGHRLTVEYSPAVIYEIPRLCTEYFTKRTVYCKVERFDLWFTTDYSTFMWLRWRLRVVYR